MKLTTTFELFQPDALGEGLAVFEMSGTVLSILTAADAVAENPALLTAVPGTSCFAPSVESETGAVHEAMPTTGSVQLKLTVTFALFQPAEFGGGAIPGVI